MDGTIEGKKGRFSPPQKKHDESVFHHQEKCDVMGFNGIQWDLTINKWGLNGD